VASEKQLQLQAAAWYSGQGYTVMQSLRLHPCEFDVVIRAPQSARLHSVEIKRKNWTKLLSQCMRAQLYFYYTTAILPIRMLDSQFLEEFVSRGIGITVYWERENRINYEEIIPSVTSGVINRALNDRVGHLFRLQCAGDGHVDQYE
jgi:hypothetical protein